MNIFITGASGFVGKAFLKKLKPLLAGADRAYCLSRLPAAADAEHIIPLVGDLRAPETFKTELLGSDYVVHIGGAPDLSANKEEAGLNYTSTRDLLAMVKGLGRIKKFIYVSSIAAAGRPRGPIAGPLTADNSALPGSEYGLSKRKAEEAVIASGLPFTIFRPGFVYGEGMRPRSHINRFVSLAVRNSPLAHFNFPGKLSLIHVDDLAAALAGSLAAGPASGNIYFAQTETRTAGEIFSLIKTVLTGAAPRQVPVPGLNSLPWFFRRFIPAGAMALLSDSFWARDAAFSRDFMKEPGPRRIDGSIWDVIKSNQDFILKQAQKRG